MEVRHILLMAILIFLSGCTIKFKATDLEVDSEMVQAYQLECIQFAKGE